MIKAYPVNKKMSESKAGVLYRIFHSALDTVTEQKAASNQKGLSLPGFETALFYSINID